MFFANFSIHDHFPLRIYSINVTKSQETADLFTFIEEILNGKPRFLCSDRHFIKIKNRLKCYKLKLLLDTNKISG